MSQRKVYDSGGRFEGKWASVYNSCSGLSLIVTCIEVTEQICQRIRGNRTISTDHTASEMSTSDGKQECKNGLSFNREYFIPMKLGSRRFANRGSYVGK
jgi:hypothetical protein